MPIPVSSAYSRIIEYFPSGGVRESATMRAPIFLTFVVTHVLLIGSGILSHAGQVGVVTHQTRADYKSGLAALSGWLTLVITSFVIGLCYLTRTHYNKFKGGVRELDDLLKIPATGRPNASPPDPKAMTAIQQELRWKGITTVILPIRINI